MTATPSLRVRLTLIVLLPLLLIAMGIGAWALQDAQSRGQERFDLSLLFTAYAISRDVGLSGGDALSLSTVDLISNTSGGQVFYHAYAPDGAFVTGYATPPIPDAEVLKDEQPQTFFDAEYKGQEVRVLRLRDAMQIGGLTGDFTFTVWQDKEVLNALVRDLARQTITVIATLIASLALIVWFGVGLGLRPLNDLEAAISRRSPDDLAPIQRDVPEEVQGIVGTLNALLGQVSATIENKNTFISNAAHQLRNPIAGVLAMAQAVRSSPDADAAQERSSDLVDAAQHASNLANQLLTFERANAMDGQEGFKRFNLGAMVAEIVEAHRPDVAAKNIRISMIGPKAPILLLGDALMIGEALSNLIDNALVHGGPKMTEIRVGLSQSHDSVELSVSDNGIGIDAEMRETALERFSQISPAKGSGLGLPIARAVAVRHGGSLELRGADHGVIVVLKFPK